MQEIPSHGIINHIPENNHPQPIFHMRGIWNLAVKGGGIGEVAFGIFWRLSILSLPWQSRWFQEANLAGWPWEQGSAAIYVSWLLLIVTIFLGLRFGTGTQEKEVVEDWRKGTIKVLAIGFITFSILRSASSAASIQWWLQIAILGMFVHVLRLRKVSAASVAGWLGLSLLPQALLAYWQFAVQRVDSASWLGIAFQSPKQLGVSVVDFADMRYLRAYGGMPHPNIMGGWLAMGTLIAIWSSWRADSKRRALMFAAVGSVFSGASVLTFSRSAFLALAAGLVALSVGFVLGRRKRLGDFQFGLMALFCAVLFSVILGFSQREVLLARTQEENRLEAKSLSARAESMKRGWEVLKPHWVLGSGPNAELAALAEEKFNVEAKRSAEPLESPHNSFMLLLVNFGVVGALAVLYLAASARRRLSRSWYFFLPLAVLAWFDHYLWSYWPGQVLFASVALLAATNQADETMNEELVSDP